jgi:hypothetical protein
MHMFTWKGYSADIPFLGVRVADPDVAAAVDAAASSSSGVHVSQRSF